MLSNMLKFQHTPVCISALNSLYLTQHVSSCSSSLHVTHNLLPLHYQISAKDTFTQSNKCSCFLIRIQRSLVSKYTFSFLHSSFLGEMSMHIYSEWILLVIHNFWFVYISKTRATWEPLDLVICANWLEMCLFLFSTIMAVCTISQTRNLIFLGFISVLIWEEQIPSIVLAQSIWNKDSCLFCTVGTKHSTKLMNVKKTESLL